MILFNIMTITFVGSVPTYKTTIKEEVLFALPYPPL